MKFRKLVMEFGLIAVAAAVISVPSAVSVSAAETVTGEAAAYVSEGDAADSQSAENNLQETSEETEESEWTGRLLAVVEEDSYLNIRSEAGTDGEVVGRMERGDGADIVEKGEEWTKIVSGDVEGYVKNEYCLFEEEAEAQAEKICGVEATSTTDGLRIRSEENTESTVLHVLNEGESISVVLSEEDAETDDTKEEATAESDTKSADTQTEIGVVADETVGATVQISADEVQLGTDEEETKEPEWIQVEYNGQTAYVYSEYVEVAVNVGEAQSMEEIRAEQAAKAAASAARQSTGTSQGSTGTTQGSAVSASTDDVTLLAAIIQCEAGGESYEGQLAVGAVVMNRVKSGSFPNSISGVIYQSGQFTPASSGKLSRVLSSGSISSSCYQAANEAINGADNTGGALYFHAGSGNGRVIGNQVFY